MAKLNQNTKGPLLKTIGAELTKKRNIPGAIRKVRRVMRQQKRQLLGQPPPAHLPPQIKPAREIVVACILDEFSFENFAPEARLLKLHPKNWKQQLDENSPEMLLVESAWAGNDSQWQYLITYKEPRDSNPLFALLEYCKERGIPRVFWNKEDPPNFDKFIDAAQRFDYIFTTDANCVPRYKELLPDAHVEALPFAAQPRTQNPVDSAQVEKLGDICFAGAWYPRHPERFEDLQLLLNSSMPYKLDIYDRYFNHPQSDKYRYPEQYQPFIRGSLTFSEMTKAYRQYGLFLNVNSVKDSPTMFSRRVLEIIAAGTPVVSGYAEGIESMLGSDVVPMIKTQEEADEAVKLLMSDPIERDRRVVLGQRKIFSEHTYEKRFEQICRTVGIVAERPPEMITVITATIRKAFVDSFLENFKRQTYANKELIVVVNEGRELTEDYVMERASALNVEGVRVLVCGPKITLGGCLNAGLLDANGSLFAKMDDDDFYGEHYLEDSILALKYSGADCVGKEAYFTYAEGRDATFLQRPTRQHLFTKFVIGTTLVGYTSLYPEVSFGNTKVGEDSEFLRRMARAGKRVYSHSKYNYIKLYAKDLKHHTWQIQEQQYLNGSEFLADGYAKSRVCF